MAQVHLIDISSCQPDTRIDWPTVAHATIDGEPVVGVIVKATDGNGGVDPDFAAHVRGIRSTDAARIASGLRPFSIGAYHFAHPDRTELDAVHEADHFLDACSPLGPFEMYMLDSEEARTIDIGAPFQKWMLDFCDRVETRTGRLPLYYTGGPFFTEHASKMDADTFARFARLPLALAAYVADPSKYLPLPWAPNSWTLHQRSGDQAPGRETPLHVPGIDGGKVNVDHDVFKGSLDAYYAWLALRPAYPKDPGVDFGGGNPGIQTHLEWWPGREPGDL